MFYNGFIYYICFVTFCGGGISCTIGVELFLECPFGSSPFGRRFTLAGCFTVDTFTSCGYRQHSKSLGMSLK